MPEQIELLVFDWKKICSTNSSARKEAKKKEVRKLNNKNLRLKSCGTARREFLRSEFDKVVNWDPPAFRARRTCLYLRCVCHSSASHPCNFNSFVIVENFATRIRSAQEGSVFQFLFAHSKHARALDAEILSFHQRNLLTQTNYSRSARARAWRFCKKSELNREFFPGARKSWMNLVGEQTSRVSVSRENSFGTRANKARQKTCLI